MSDRSAMHCHLHGDYRCSKCFSVFGYDKSVQYVQGLEAQLVENERLKAELTDYMLGFATANEDRQRLEAQLAAER